MKKIIFFENKIDRKKNYNIDFEKYSNLVSVFGNEKCNQELDRFLQDNNIIDQYDTILIHATIYYEDKRSELFKVLKEYCRNKINLVIFSGGGDIGSLNNNILEVTARSFYENIEIFLERHQDTPNNLFMLAYGEYWDLNILLNTLEKINILIEDNDNNEFIEDYDEFEDDFNFLKIKKVLDIKEYKIIFTNIDINDDEIDINQIKTIRNNLISLINEKTNE
jgi:hypothetical protein